MADSSVDQSLINRCVDCTNKLLEQNCYAQAVAFLFYVHKQHIDEWVAIQSKMLSNAVSHREFSIVADLFEASRRQTLGESSYLFPGLSDLLESQDCRELLD